MINYEDAVKKPFTDLGKLFLGIILSAVPVINWVTQGFVLECSGVGSNKPSRKMPGWNKFEDLFIKGFMSYLIMFIYAIPSLIVLTLSIGYTAAYLLPTFIGLMPEGVSTTVAAGGLREIFSQNWMQMLPTLLSMSAIVIPMILLGLLLMLVAVFLSPIGILNYIKTKKFGKAFDLNLVTKKAFKSKYVLAWLVSVIIAMVLKSVLILWLGPWIGSAATFFISSTIAFSLFGQLFIEK
ncbi:MAG: DUF4013 domain-containing protein [Candidatus Aenigmatarchaeota archaeon]